MNKLKLFFVILCAHASAQSFSQSETHNFTTYDTLINAPYSGITWRARISRPVNMFTPNNPDTASRPAIITIPGQGEMGTNFATLQTYGPHYWLNHGWDGGIQLGNGMHYPILITIISSNTYMTAQEASDVLDILLNKFHIKKNSVHAAGLSQGAFALSSMILFEQTAGAETGMKKLKSLVCLEGASSELPYPFSSWSRGPSGWGYWAQKYGGKFFGLEGTADYRVVSRVSEPMNQVVPGSGYFAYENIGGGTHCCWNTMYDPSRTNWTSVGILGLNIATGEHPNTMGTYYNGTNIFKWMLRQGDTTLAGSGAPAPPSNMQPSANAGTDQSIVLPTNSVALNGSGIDPDGAVTTYSWSEVSGGTATIMTPSSPSTAITGLAQGSYVFRLTVTDNGGATNIDDVTVTVAPQPAPTPPASTYPAIPAKIEAESYSKMYGIQTQTTDDAGGGLNVGWIDNGDWMEYNISAPAAGTYSVNFRVASQNTNTTFQVKKSDGTVLATLTIPNTGGYQTWQTITAPVALVSGNQTLRIVSTASQYWNINWIDFGAASASTSQPPPPPLPTSSDTTRVEAETYAAMSGIQTENTQDVGGGLDIGWVDNGDWMNYTVNPAATGTYTFRFRVSSPYYGGQFQLKRSDGTVLATVSVPNTGGYQAWQTVSVPVSLASGSQTVKIVATVQPWNINWFEMVSPTSTASATGRSAAVVADSTISTIDVAPSQITDKFLVTVNNAATGVLNIVMTNESGAAVKEYHLAKSSAQSTQVYLSAADLPAGNYTVTVQIGTWTESKQIKKS